MHKHSAEKKVKHAFIHAPFSRRCCALGKEPPHYVITYLVIPTCALVITCTKVHIKASSAGPSRHADHCGAFSLPCSLPSSLLFSIIPCEQMFWGWPQVGLPSREASLLGQWRVQEVLPFLPPARVCSDTVSYRSRRTPSLHAMQSKKWDPDVRHESDGL